MVRYRVLDKYENGCAAIRGIESHYVRTEDDNEIPMGTPYGVAGTRTRLYAALRVQFGHIPLIDDQDLIPVDLAVSGKPVIAAYLYVAHWDDYSSDRKRKKEVADRLDVDIGTVIKYFRRVLKQVEDKRLGGRGR